ncbi:MAG: phosphodiester glycosidase family protein [Mogibacterium sp.]|nr:phosphodiester glycosidase family protein [Mogibacterium sp.]
MKQILLIPALEPDAKLITLVRELLARGFGRIVVVDDGSGERSQCVFDVLEVLAGPHDTDRASAVTVVHHDYNMGKGAAIKTGLSAAIDLYDRDVGVITADADGQHRPDDIVRIAAAMDAHPNDLILGTRDFSQSNVPTKSRLGNRITSFFFRLTTGVRCSDTQTGLRGIPSNLLGLALRESGDRYEYEMNFLQDAVEAAAITSVPIATVYEDNNRGSHFRPVRDSLRVYGRLLRFLASSLIGAATDYVLFLLLLAALGETASGAAAGTWSQLFTTGAVISSGILLATVLARICSGTVNFLLNKYWSFESRQRTAREAARYLALFLTLMLLSAAGVSLLLHVIPTALAKLLVDTVLFFASYTVQKRWVFRKDTTMKQHKKRRLRWAPVYGVVLTLYAAFTLTYTFLIPQDVVAIDEMEEAPVVAENDGTDFAASEPADASTDALTSGSGTAAEAADDASQTIDASHDEDASYDDNASHKDDTSPTGEVIITDTTYESDRLSVTITQTRIADTDVYIADVVLKDGNTLQSGLAYNSFGRNLNAKTSEIAEDSGAVLAINGDYYGFRDTGYVMRNGYLYRTTPSGGEDLVVYADGSMEVINEYDVTAEELQASGAVQIYSFGPGLVVDGEVAVSYGEEVGQSMRSNPRTAIGMIDETHYVFVVSDGRTSASAGLDLYDLACLMQDLGCKTAYNLDGGGSTTMWFNGRIVNNPTGGHAGHGSSERSVSDIVYVGE